MDDLFEDGPCASCGNGPSPSLHVAWRPAFGQYLCTGCCKSRSEAELSATERANTQARLAAKNAARAAAKRA